MNDTLFSSKRCKVRKLNLDDFDEFHQMQSNPEVMKFADGSVQNEKESLDDLTNLIGQYQKDSPSLLIYAIINEQQLFIGTFAIVFNKDRSSQGEIGYRFLAKHWGKGYAKEILKEILPFCFNEFKLNEILAYCFVENIASIKLLEQNNFRLIEESIDKKTGLLDRKYLLSRS